MSEPTLYEAIYILDTSLPEDEAAELIATLEQAVRGAGGEVVGTRDFRTRRLAYEINGHTHGAYKLLYFHGDGAVVEALRTEMAVRQPIIRSRIFVANPEALIGDTEAAIAEEETAESTADEAPTGAAEGEAAIPTEEPAEVAGDEGATEAAPSPEEQ